MSTEGSPGSVEVDFFRSAWRKSAKAHAVSAPLPASWQGEFYRVLAGRRTSDLVGLIPAAMKPGIDNRWRYFLAVARNN